jgi:hypothetical protein
MGKIKSWYKGLPVKQQMIVFFLVQWFYWFAAWILFDFVWPDEKPASILSMLFKASWMAIWMTVIFNWSKIKQLRKK